MSTGHIAIGLAVVVTMVPAAFAQSAGTRTKEERQPQNETGITLAVPIGKAWVDPQTVTGEAVYVRRTTVGKGMTVVEVSTTPFMPVLASNDGPQIQATVRPDQPASW